jgi:hypothetical protein
LTPPDPPGRFWSIFDHFGPPHGMTIFDHFWVDFYPSIFDHFLTIFGSIYNHPILDIYKRYF